MIQEQNFDRQKESCEVEITGADVTLVEKLELLESFEDCRELKELTVEP